jgi:hypothetical protein
MRSAFFDTSEKLRHDFSYDLAFKIIHNDQSLPDRIFTALSAHVPPCSRLVIWRRDPSKYPIRLFQTVQLA